MQQNTKKVRTLTEVEQALLHKLEEATNNEDCELIAVLSAAVQRIHSINKE